MSTSIRKEQKNGTATPSTKATGVKPQLEQQQAKKPTLEERIQRVEELRSLTGKRQRTVETLHNIRTFQFGSDDNCTLMLTDSQGMRFTTNNSTLISILSDYFVSVLSDKVSALDEEILSFKL